MESITTKRAKAAKAAVALAAIALAVAAYCTYEGPDPTPPVVPEEAPHAAPAAREPDIEAVRAAAWQKVAPRIAAAERASQEAAAESFAAVRAFVAQRRGRAARAFAAEVLSLGGKWAYLKDTFEPGAHEEFLAEAFEKHVFRHEELSKLIETAVTGYVSRLEGIENQLLVDVRADLADSEIAGPGLLPAVTDEAVFRQQYAALIAEVTAAVARDTAVAAGREVVSFVGGDLATPVLTEIAKALAVRLGVSSGVLSVGVTSAVFTLGVGIVANLIVDMALDWLLLQAGYDPEAEVAAKVGRSLDTLERLILEGPRSSDFTDEDRNPPPAPPVMDSSFWRFVIGDDADDDDDEPTVPHHVLVARAATARAVDKTPGCLGMRYQLEQLHAVRAQIRKAALKRLILEGGVK